VRFEGFKTLSTDYADYRDEKPETRKPLSADWTVYGTFL
jgi:hypothetical protein